MGSPRAIARDMEGGKTRSSSSWDWIRGYGSMGLSFSSGHLLAFSRATASSLGPPFTSVWHRDPEGDWTVFVNKAPFLTCSRYFGSAVGRVVEVDINLTWEGTGRLIVTVPDAQLQWALHLSADLATRSLSWLAGAFPLWLARRRRVLETAGRLVGKLLDSGELCLAGTAPSGHWFVTIPRAIWRIEAAAAVVEGRDLGPLGSLRDPARLGDFLVPNRGLFFHGEAGFQASQPVDHPSPQASGGRSGGNGLLQSPAEDQDETRHLREEGGRPEVPAAMDPKEFRRA